MNGNEGDRDLPPTAVWHDIAVRNLEFRNDRLRGEVVRGNGIRIHNLPRRLQLHRPCRKFQFLWVGQEQRRLGGQLVLLDEIGKDVIDVNGVVNRISVLVDQQSSQGTRLVHARVDARRLSWR